MTDRVGFYSGSFDPITNGHVDVIQAALHIFDTVVVGVGVHAQKKGLFSFDERKALIEASMADAQLIEGKVSVVSFDNLVVNAAKASGSSAIVRGLRDAADFAYEMQMAGMNSAMAEGIPTIFVPASAQTRPISATLVRQIALMGGDVSSFVPDVVAKALQNLKS